MIPPVRLPGNIPGLVQDGSPVAWRGQAGWTVVRVRHEAHDAMIAHKWTGEVRWVSLDDLELDLEQRTGRTHALWSLMSAMGRGVDPYVEWRHIGNGRWTASRFLEFRVPGRCVNRAGADAEMSALADLDPYDPYTLADGSRWVDAEALRRVRWHIHADRSGVAA